MTAYEVVFREVTFKIKDYSLAQFAPDLAEDYLISLMNSAIFNFEYPRVNLKDKDDTTKVFNSTLDFDTIQLLAELMAHDWLRGVSMDIDLMKPTMTPEEFKTFSGGNALSTLDKKIESNAKRVYALKKAYSARDEANKSKLGVLAGSGR